MTAHKPLLTMHCNNCGNEFDVEYDVFSKLMPSDTVNFCACGYRCTYLDYMTMELARLAKGKSSCSNEP